MEDGSVKGRNRKKNLVGLDLDRPSQLHRLSKDRHQECGLPASDGARELKPERARIRDKESSNENGRNETNDVKFSWSKGKIDILENCSFSIPSERAHLDDGLDGSRISVSRRRERLELFRQDEEGLNCRTLRERVQNQDHLVQTR